MCRWGPRRPAGPPRGSLPREGRTRGARPSRGRAGGGAAAPGLGAKGWGERGGRGEQGSRGGRRPSAGDGADLIAVTLEAAEGLLVDPVTRTDRHVPTRGSRHQTPDCRQPQPPRGAFLWGPCSALAIRAENVALMGLQFPRFPRPVPDYFLRFARSFLEKSTPEVNLITVVISGLKYLLQ